MKLSDMERKALAMMRQLYVQQRAEVLAEMERRLIANRVSMRVGKLRRLKPPADKKVATAFGKVPAKE